MAIYVKPKVAAAMLGVDTSTIHRWRIKGILSKYKKQGNAFVYPLSSIKAILEESNVEMVSSNDIVIDSLDELENL